MAARLYVFIWCPECNGWDQDGCFAGEHERKGPFDSREEAEAAAEEATKGTNWCSSVEWVNA